MKQTESKTQKACVDWFRLQYPRYAKLLFSVPNGGYRNPVTGAIMKAEGALAGVSDLIFLYPCNEYHGLCIEMKTATGRQQPTQKAWQEAVEAMGYKYVICRSIEDFMKEIREYTYIKF